MLCKYYWIVLYNVHVTAFCLGGAVFSRTRCSTRVTTKERLQLRVAYTGCFMLNELIQCFNARLGFWWHLHLPRQLIRIPSHDTAQLETTHRAQTSATADHKKSSQNDSEHTLS